MRWAGRRESSNVEDRRGSGGTVRRGAAMGGGLFVVVALVAVLTGEDLSGILNLLSGMQGTGRTGASVGAEPQAGGAAPVDDEQSRFVRVVLADTEETWTQVFAEQLNAQYQPPKLVLFDGAVESACGYASAAVGPFYCPGDYQVYIDLAFFRELDSRFGAPGDFAQAYVISHEVGHHLQSLLGISEQVQRARSQVGEVEGNELSVRQELQADCYAGVWGHHASTQRQLLEEGDVEEGLNAAKAIGDDTLQRRAGGYVSPESWTHGSSEQRVRWFKTGLQSGRLDSCDTFSATRL